MEINKQQILETATKTASDKAIGALAKIAFIFIMPVIFMNGYAVLARLVDLPALAYWDFFWLRWAISGAIQMVGGLWRKD